jgi:hypothetical protein
MADPAIITEPVKSVHLTMWEVTRLLNLLNEDPRSDEQDRDLFLKLMRLQYRFEKQASPWTV